MKGGRSQFKELLRRVVRTRTRDDEKKVEEDEEGKSKTHRTTNSQQSSSSCREMNRAHKESRISLESSDEHSRRDEERRGYEQPRTFLPQCRAR